jgi:hypothetical protein
LAFPENDKDYLQLAGREEALNMLVGSNSAVTANRESMSPLTYDSPVGALFTYTIDLASDQLSAGEQLNGPYRYWTLLSSDLAGGGATMKIVFDSANNTEALGRMGEIIGGGTAVGSTHIEFSCSILLPGIPRTYFFRDGCNRIDFVTLGASSLYAEIR